MNTTDRELEELLTKLPREQPSATLDARMAKLFAAAEARHDEVIATLRPRTFWPRLLASGLAMAACLLLAVIVAMNTAAPTGETKDRSAQGIIPSPANNAGHESDTLDFKPVRIEQVWSQIQPGGIITLDDNTPLRRFRRHTVEHVQLIDDKQNIRIEYTRPRNDTIVVPVRYD